MNDRAMGIKEAAQYLGIAENTLRNWHVKRQGPPFYRMGNKIVYREKELRLWMDQRRVDFEKDRTA